MICCGDPMEELSPNTVEAATEKHIPEVHFNKGLVHVKVGSVAHPTTEEHHIDFIYLQTEHGGQMRCLKVGAEATAEFTVLEDKPLEVYANCNLHGLWKSVVPCDSVCNHTEAGIEEASCSAEFSEGCK